MTILSSLSGSFNVAKSGGSAAPTVNAIDATAPFLYYKNESLSSFSENADITTWVNSGSAGTGYNLTQASTWSTRPFMQTLGGYKSARFDSSTRGLQFSNGNAITVQSSDNRNWTMLSVMRADDGNMYFFGNYQSNSNVGGIGWYGTTQLQWMYENDGATPNPSVGSFYGTTTQYIMVARDNNTTTWWKDKTSGPFYDTTAASSYGATLSFRGIGSSRSRYGLGNILETAYWQRALSNAEVASIRSYLGSKFANIGSVNS